MRVVVAVLVAGLLIVAALNLLARKVTHWNELTPDEKVERLAAMVSASLLWEFIATLALVALYAAWTWGW